LILLADANILFDFGWVEEGLRHLAFLGPLEVLENVRDEILEDAILQTLSDLNVTIIPLQDDWENAIRDAKRSGLSLPDASCLHYARENGRTVVTSERALRKCCQDEGVSVHGSLWVVRQLHERGQCVPELLCGWLDSWVADDARLPDDALAEIRDLLGCTNFK
jgi:predicted nucleic acid-binding protein